jgi:hypothetical protein
MFSWRCFPFVESAPRAYRLKASNAAPLSSTSAGTFPSRAFEVDRSITAHWIIGIHAHQANIPPHLCEPLAAIVLKNAFRDFVAFGEGKWFEYLASQQYRFNTRPILISRASYQEHLKASEGHAGVRLTDQEISLTNALPDWFWMVEFVCPLCSPVTGPN